MTANLSYEIDPYLKELVERNGSDLLLVAGAAPLYRVDGVLQQAEGVEKLTPEDTERIISELVPGDLVEKLREDKDLDFSFNWHGDARFRANIFWQRSSMAIALRLIPYRIPSFEELSLPGVVEQLVNLPNGLIMVTGPTGSGKSTTLASMVEYINEHRPCHILTIEDPIEYVYKHRVAAVNQREIGEDTHSFDRALRAALRENPDVLLVGEMRDLETIRNTLTIAETGHLVFATLHTNDTAQAIDRVIDVFPAEQQAQIRVQLANALQAVFYQQLIPRIGGGRVAAFEVLIANTAIRNLIKEGKTRQIRNVVATHQKEGMQTFEIALNELIASGAITHEDAVARSMHPTEVRKAGPALRR